jgi:hypothetical protein
MIIDFDDENYMPAAVTMFSDWLPLKSITVVFVTAVCLRMFLINIVEKKRDVFNS